MKDAQRLAQVGFDRHFSTASWEEANKAFFDQLAPKYDWLNEVISLGQIRQFRSSAIRALHLKSGFRVLDACTGSGDMAIAISRSCRGVRVDAVDVAPVMLSLAVDKVKRTGLGDIHFHEASALALPFEDNSFDAAMMGFGLRNLKDIPLGLAEMHRVLKPGGIFTTLDLGKPSDRWCRSLYHLYFERLMPWLGRRLFHRNEYNSFLYLSTSNKYFPDPEIIMDRMSDAGFTKVCGKTYMFEGVAQQVGTKQ